MNGVFITATGTGVGKTWFGCALTRAIAARGTRIAAIKPLETGVDPRAQDAEALAEACGRSTLANAPGLYRAREPLAPYAVQKRGGPAVGSLEVLASRIEELASEADFALVEGAGGVLVPLDETQTIADLAKLVGLPAIVVARNELGVLSYTLTAVASLRQHEVPVCAVVLNQVDRRDLNDDLSLESNHELLADYLPDIPVFRAPHADQPEALTATATKLIARIGL